ncbi:XRE family transcriptional regulator [Virgisporangium ochraceum]|uniref:HTH cro/C1-type domain-containing protein n=1 Tax=Virgisporangium ochraceum TaxID=65505 RepID=A0A8J3ZT00_9ACTN|nr:XRE family transcriptional regulator [Virgisporangium ochraceum]GIJ69617.1 hypothetical protein Voc01_045340 [Virgisporangium ochraceum]
MDDRDRSPGALIAAARRRAGLTQADVAEQAGLSVRAISNIERNVHSRLRRDSLARIARVLDLDAEQVAALRGVRIRPGTGVLDPVTGARTPAQLPMAVPDLVGRATLAATVADALTADRIRGCPSVVVLSGEVGVGKTALAVHVGHRVRASFPDGQLFLDLGGSADALTGALFAIGHTDGRLPAEPAARAAMLRSGLSDRRVLLVIDGATTEAQVRALLPGSSGCAVLVTSRSRLTGLEGATRIGVDPLDEATAVDLIRRTAGMGAGPTTALRALARRCGRSPLALRAVGLRLATHPDLPPDDLAGLLGTAARPLDLLVAGDLAVRDRLATAYGALTEAGRRLFARLSTVDSTDLTPHGVAAAASLSPEDARHLLDGIADSGLLHRLATPAPGGRHFHLGGPAREFAREVAA